MKVDVVQGDLAAVEGRCLLVLATNDGTLLNGPAPLAEFLAPLVETEEFGKSLGGHYYHINPAGFAVQRVLFFNVGEKVEKDQLLRRAGASAWKLLRGKGLEEVVVSLDGLDQGAAKAVLDGLFLGSYQYTELKSDKDKLPKSLNHVKVHAAENLTELVRQTKALCDGTNRARDLYQMPANLLNPTKLADTAKAWAEDRGFTLSILEEDEMREMGMGSLLSVSQGSDEPGKLIIMEYNPAGESEKTFALVGKAVTFDSGGLSLKPSNAMAEMKGDMGGGATVFGIMSVLRDLNFPHRVVGLVPSVENMPSGKATRPSDVVTSLSGVTIEINNTDAEGRLIMADTLTYAKKFNPDYVIDFATLTGACLVALGPKVCAVMGNHEPLVEAILEGGKAYGEPFWELPLVEEYKELLKSKVADISNISSVRWGGTITAGLFLERFAGDFQWAHCDIASAIFEKGDEINPAGGTGIGVRAGYGALVRMS
ncbi:leucyl aminopeptidase [Acanthopleuribacter pedis]|uniref:Probable cytosol aminopeptidase n=1 Tax=Acanthopleuribacter pedis TaxID=442870 RepID=A0A8J7QLV6_9BACT|nr:leucyl aminopeptidase [Acanthopleuribacter pedis]MBO1320723.1 leucyl aminopeptidase [Acanthopleuribacter pedis]